MRNDISNTTLDLVWEMFKKIKMLLMFLMMSSVSKILSETIPIDIYTPSHLINLMSPFYALLFGPCLQVYTDFKKIV